MLISRLCDIKISREYARISILRSREIGTIRCNIYVYILQMRDGSVTAHEIPV